MEVKDPILRELLASHVQTEYLDLCARYDYYPTHTLENLMKTDYGYLIRLGCKKKRLNNDKQ